MLDTIEIKPIERDSSDFLKLEEFANAQLSAILADNSGTLLSRLLTHVRFSKLNAQLSFFGWAIKRDRQLIQVRIRGQVHHREKPEESENSIDNVEANRERVKRAYVQTGKIIDPQSGRVLPRSEGNRFGIS